MISQPQARMSIMIVDDNPRYAGVVKEFLKREFSQMGEVYTCIDGPEAVATYEQYRPDWILMDVRLSTCDGFAVAKQIQLSSTRARIVFLTQFNEAVYRDAALEMGAFFVTKDELRTLGFILRHARPIPDQNNWRTPT